MEPRSIDTAKNASIDLMTLNKKVVNMRAIVKRSKVHIINKLNRNIADLKKKKGTEDEKEKNLKKAQRYIQEIQSIRSLKEDNITKYSLANVSTFEQVSKSTLSSGARALARLADHDSIKDAVLKFREEHNDWRDLAAYMLMQQTGRKFKTQKKEKGKKLISQAENINASKLMTEAYNKGLFRDDGFKKSEEPFQSKRKKKLRSHEDQDESTERKIIRLDISDGNISSESEIRLKNVQETKLNISEKHHESVACMEENARKNMKPDSKDGKTKKIKNRGKGTERLDVEKNLHEMNTMKDTSVSHSSLGKSSQLNVVRQSLNLETREGVDDGEEIEMETDMGGSDECGSEEVANIKEVKTEDELSPHHPEKLTKKISKKNKECVVRQLKLGSKSDESDSGGNSELEDDSSVTSDSEDEEMGGNGLEKVNESKKSQNLPDFLTEGKSKQHRLPRDPFFEGSDVEEDFNDFEHNDPHGNDDDYDEDIQEKFKGNKKTTKSLFYRPGEEKRKKLIEKKGFSSDRKDGPGTRGRSRGGFQDKGRGFDRRGGSFREGRGRGSYKSGINDRLEKTRHKQFDLQADDKGFNASKKDFQSYPDRTKFSSTSRGESNIASKPSEKLHPSWEASRRRKAEQGGIKAFSGTKITFNDD